MNFAKVKVYDRDPINAQDHSSTEDVMLEFLNQSDYKSNDLFILSQLTSPFTKSQHLEEAISKFNSEEADSLLSCVPFKRFLWNKDGTAINYNPESRSRRQEFTGQWMENGAFYISRIGRILKTKNRLSGKIAIYEMPEYTGIELDEPHDWIIAEALMKKLCRSDQD